MVSQAFPNYIEISLLKDNCEKHRAWLKQYEGLYFSIAEKEQDKILWQKEKELYVYSDKRFNEPILCLDDTYRSNPNKIQRHPRILPIEFDDKLPDGKKKDLVKIKDNIQKTKEKIKSHNWGYIESTHHGVSNYIWVQFTREITSNEAEKFLLWIAPEGSEIDSNFASDNKRFPVLFAQHWKYPKERELPVEYHPGNQIDIDSLDLSKNIDAKIIRSYSEQGEYVTAIKQSSKDYSPIKAGTFLKEKQEKEHPIIKNFFPEKSISILFGEPASCKSLFLNYVGACVSTGKKFLDKYPTRKMPVLLLSTENPERTDRKRLNSIYKGMRILAKRRIFRNLQLLYCGRHKISVLNDPTYYSELQNVIQTNGIKLLLIDTISPLIMDRNDNLASEIVETFNNRLFPLIDKFGLSIFLTMHSQKSGKDFLGSVKIKASSDTFYELMREENTLSLLCHKNREGEHNLKLKIGFIVDKKEQLDRVTFDFIEEFKGKQSVRNKDNNPIKLEQAKEAICEMLEVKELRHNEIIKECTSLGHSISTSKKAMNLLYENQKIKKKHGKEGGYYLP